METPPDEEDRFLQERQFGIGSGIDISDLLDDVADSFKEESKLEKADEKPEEDAAIGEILDPFAEDDGIGPGRVMRDGSVPIAPERDLIEDIAIQGEIRLNWALMGAMITVYSAISILIGTVVENPLFALLGLMALAGFGFTLGERWVPRPAMRQLGIVWLIIAMKILYGLAIELGSWELFGLFPLSENYVGVLLLALVGVNVGVAYRYDEDAIAAQAVLVLLAISSTVGSLLGEIGVAGMIFGASVLFQLLALHRRSGNLASLGIASSNLWIGMHALTNGFEIGSLTVVPIETPLVLFLLLIFTNAINAAMASRFSASENWFSTGLNVVGLGRPGLWSVSVGLGLIGALMAIGANREDSSFALAMVTGLLTVFSGSYLTVRGVPPSRIIALNGGGLCALTFLLIILDAGLFELPSFIDAYGTFTVGAVIIAAWLILSNQDNVTDRVLWTGAVSIVVLLTVLIPSRPSTEGGDGGLLLLSSVLLMMIATTYLAVRRTSPSLSGVTALLPWTWVLFMGALTSIVQTFSVTNDFSGLPTVQFDGTPLTFFLGVSALLQLIVNLNYPDGGVNLAERFLGTQEVSARLRDSGLMKVWNLGFILGLIALLSVTVEDGMTGSHLLVLFSVFLGIHIGADAFDRHQGNPRLLLVMSALTIYVLIWRHEMAAYWLVLLLISTNALTWTHRGRSEESNLHILNLSTIGFGVLVWGTSMDRVAAYPMTAPFLLDDAGTAWIMLICTSIPILAFLPRISHLNEIIRSSFAALFLMSSITVSFILTGHSALHLYAALFLFAVSSLMISVNGELRSEIRQVTTRDKQLSSLIQAQEIIQKLSSENETGEPLSQNLLMFNSEASAEAALALSPEARAKTAVAQSGSGMRVIDPRIVELLQKQKKRAKVSDASGIKDLMVGDIHHRPVVVTSFLGVMLVAGLAISLLFPSALMLALIGIGLQSILLTIVSRWRANESNLTLPDIAGIESPIAITMVGLAVIVGLGSSVVGASISDQRLLLILAAMNLVLITVSLFGRKDILKRIPSALEWLLGTLFIARILGIPLGGTPSFGSVDVLSDTHPFISWTMIWVTLEIVLIGMALLWDWIEGRRREAGLEDHRSAGGRVVWAFGIALLSVGPAGLIASILGLRRGIQWTQSAVLMGTVLSIAISIFALSSSVSILQENLGYILLTMGSASFVATLFTIQEPRRIWTSAHLIDAHILLVLGILISPLPNIAFLSTLLILSTLTWLTGILQLRKMLRFWGATDLVFAGLMAILTIGSELLEPTNAFIALIVLAIELGLVVWLAQSRQAAMMAQE
ncbi:MAG TPA: hypothetical protein HA330_01145 [Candidatus Thalassarchaeaceae archaeon]|nr:MAG TPA: hypothetical protein D7H85_01155 [Candidatus Poseidoniales archaeon]HII48470.1 hypothetical protein [Candidatus Thalassarchaeaceae archaeon]